MRHPNHLAATLLFAALAAMAATAADAHSKKREAKAHVHGRGTLAIVVEGNTVGLELSVPAHDIVGFEHAPKSAAQKSAVAEAEIKLGSILTLVKVPEAAGCTIAKSAVQMEQDEADASAKSGKHDHSHGHGHSHDHGEGGHAEFKATYELACSDARALTSLAFPYFAAFPKAEALTVTVVTAKGQAQYEVTRTRTQLDLAGAG
ncbi:MAG: DUF2796 domain-containing protein [Hyphomicrobiaceae bacterium]|nr:DUF2796 domain-containing protein [Hyphomicrobiaceae bacterium]